MKEHFHSRIAKLLVVLALAVVASVMFVFVGCSNECAHENTHTETVAATCTTAGSEKTVCDDCGETIKTETIDAIGHKWDDGTVVAATCTSGGYTLKTCTVCGAQQQTNLTTAKGHDWSDWSVQTAATCTTTGLEVRTCASCKAEESRVLSATGHDWSDWSVKTEATCASSGLEVRTCTKCDAEESRILPATGNHDWETVTNPATCAEAGSTYQLCSNCGAIQGMQTIPATGNHNWEKGETVPATCVTNGYTEYTCSVCGTTKQDEIVYATGHVWDNDVVLTEAATCTTDGYYYLKCENCIERQTLDVIPATGHDYEWTVTQTYGCTTDGTLEGVCATCGNEVTYAADSIPADVLADLADEPFYEENKSVNGFLQASGHNYISVNHLTGYADSKHEFDTPSAGGHDDALYQICEDIGVLNADTDNEVDYTGYSLVCTECDVAVETAAHTPDVTPAYACVDEDGDGLAWTCEVCGYEQAVEEHTPVLVAKDENGEVTDEPATVYNCLSAYVCDVCGEVLADEGPHSAPTAADTDYVANCQHGNLCTLCGKDVFGGKLPHHLVELAVGETVNGATAKDSTCTETGLRVWACEMCMDLVEKGEDIEWITLTNDEFDEGTADYKTGNFYTEAIKLKDHAWATEKVSMNPDDPKAELCITDYYLKDVCEECDKVRVEVKPAESMEENAPSGKPWTNAQGYYGFHEGEDKHNFTLVTDPDAYESASDYQLPTCSTNGKFIQICLNDGCQFSSTRKDVTLEEYAKALLKNEGYATPTEEEIAAKVDELLTKPEFHAGEMPACGEHVCDVCDDRSHGVQYVLTFEVVAGENVPEGAVLPTIGQYTNYFCLEDVVYDEMGQKTEDGEVAKFIAMMEKLDADDAVYNYQYYLTNKDGVLSDEITDWAAMLEPKGENSYSKNTTIYVKASLAEDEEVQKTYFTLDGYVASWSTTDNDLEIGWALDNTVIPYTSITSITVELKNAENAVCTTAVSKGDQLAAYIAACEPYWAEGATKLAYSIDGFTTATGAQTCWTYTNTTPINKTDNADLTGYTLTVTIECGEGIEFVATATVA